MKKMRKWLTLLALAGCIAGMCLGLIWVSDSILENQYSPLPQAQAEESAAIFPLLSPTPIATLVPMPTAQHFSMNGATPIPILDAFDGEKHLLQFDALAWESAVLAHASDSWLSNGRWYRLMDENDLAAKLTPEDVLHAVMDGNDPQFLVFPQDSLQSVLREEAGNLFEKATGVNPNELRQFTCLITETLNERQEVAERTFTWQKIGEDAGMQWVYTLRQKIASGETTYTIMEPQGTIDPADLSGLNNMVVEPFQRFIQNREVWYVCIHEESNGASWVEAAMDTAEMKTVVWVCPQWSTPEFARSQAYDFSMRDTVCMQKMAHVQQPDSPQPTPMIQAMQSNDNPFSAHAWRYDLGGYEDRALLRLAAGEMANLLSRDNENFQFVENDAMNTELTALRLEAADQFFLCTGLFPEQENYLCLIQEYRNENGQTQRVDFTWQPVDSQIQNEKIIYCMQVEIAGGMNCALLLPQGNLLTEKNLSVLRDEIRQSLELWMLLSPGAEGWYLAWHTDGQGDTWLEAAVEDETGCTSQWTCLESISTSDQVYTDGVKFSRSYRENTIHPRRIPTADNAGFLLISASPTPLAPQPMETQASSLGQQLLAALASPTPRPSYLLQDELIIMTEDSQIGAMLYRQDAQSSPASLQKNTGGISQMDFESIRDQYAQVFALATGVTPPDAGYVCHMRLQPQTGDIRILWKPADLAMAEASGLQGVATYTLSLQGRMMAFCSITGQGLEVGTAVEQMLADRLGKGARGATPWQIDAIITSGDGNLVCSGQEKDGDSAFEGQVFQFFGFDQTALQSALDQASITLLKALPQTYLDALTPHMYSKPSESAPATAAEQGILQLSNSLLSQQSAAENQVNRFHVSHLWIQKEYVYRDDGDDYPVTRAEMETLANFAQNLYQQAMGIHPCPAGYVMQVEIPALGPEIRFLWRAADEAYRRQENLPQYEMTIIPDGAFSARVQDIALPVSRLPQGLIEESFLQEMQAKSGGAIEDFIVDEMTSDGSHVLNLRVAAQPKSRIQDTAACVWAGFQPENFDRAQNDLMELLMVLQESYAP